MEKSFGERMETDPELRARVEKGEALWRREKELLAKLTPEEWEELRKIQSERAGLGKPGGKSNFFPDDR
ncbi:MAG: hypothetical protein Q7R73_00455 [bacterium]|nr:hypothetical protein [bacterium]